MWFEEPGKGLEEGIRLAGTGLSDWQGRGTSPGPLRESGLESPTPGSINYHYKLRQFLFGVMKTLGSGQWIDAYNEWIYALFVYQIGLRWVWRKQLM